MYCKKCGEKLFNNAAFCHCCGEKVSQPDIVGNYQVGVNAPLVDEGEIESEAADVDVNESEASAYGEDGSNTLDKNTISKRTELRRLKHPVIPIAFSVLFSLLLIILVLLLPICYQNLEIAKTNLSKNEPFQKKVHQISDKVDKNLSARDEIIEWLSGLTESSSSSDAYEIDGYLSRLTSLEESLQSEYDEAGKLFNKKYELFTFYEDGTIEKRNQAILAWKESRLKDYRKAYSEYLDDPNISTQERGMIESDIELDKYIAEKEADLELSFALMDCELNRYYFSQDIDNSVYRANNTLSELNGEWGGLWTAIVVSFIFLVLSVIAIFTYNKRKHPRLLTEDLIVWAFILICITMLFAVMKSVSSTKEYGEYVEMNNHIRQEIVKVEEDILFPDDAEIKLDYNTPKNVFFSWENAQSNKADAVNTILDRNMREQALWLIIPYIIVLVLLTCGLDLIIKLSPRIHLRQRQRDVASNPRN